MVSTQCALVLGQANYIYYFTSATYLIYVQVGGGGVITHYLLLANAICIQQIFHENNMKPYIFCTQFPNCTLI